MFFSVLTIFSATSAVAVDGQNEDKPLNYGLHWFKLETGALPDPSCGDNPGHSCMDAVLYSPTTQKWQKNYSAQSGDDPYYDPNKPTLIYFHGWQPGGNISREGLKWTYSSQVLDQLKPWRDAGWNVGIFYWNQFADVLPGIIPGVSQSTFGVTGAQNKIWSSKGSGEMGYKYASGIIGNYYKEPNAEDLGMPRLSDYNDPWFNGQNTSKAISAVYFIKGISPSSSSFATEVEAIKTSLDGGTSCEQMLQDTACNGSPLCAGNRLDWRELFYSKVCEQPSVGDMAFLNISEALKDQSESRVIFAGHSLGHQLATRSATQMWMAHIHSNYTGSQNVGGSLNYNALPKRLELLDPYATNVMAFALKEYTWDGNFSAWPGSRKRSRRPARRVYNYVKRLKEMTSTYAGAGGSSFSMPVTYYHSTWLAEVGGATWNPRLGEEVAYQRHYFSYLISEANRHNASKDWYLASMGQNAFFPSLNKTDSRLITQAGLSARSTDAHVLESMATAPSGGVKYYQRQGGFTWDISDDVFEPIRNFQSFEWPLHWPAHDDEAGIASRLFNNRLYITADNVIDELWVNGENVTSQLSNGGNWTAADVVENLELTNGNNVIAVKVRDVGGAGGFIAELDYEGGYHATGDAHWRVTNTNPGANWMEVDFNDSSWSATTDLGHYGSAPWYTNVSNLRNDTPARWVWSSDSNGHDNVWFRFMSRDPGPWRFRLADSSSDIRSLATAESVMNSAIQSDLADGVNDFSTVAYQLNFSDSGQQGLYQGSDVAYPNQPIDANTFAILATGTVHVDTADTYTFGFNVDDGARIKLTKDGVETVVASLDGVQGPTTRLGQIYLDNGIYEIEILAYENAGGASFEVFAARGSHTSWNANDFELLLPNHDLEKIGQPVNPVSAACLAQADACAATTNTRALACSATIISGGNNARIDSSCTSALNGAGAACAAVNTQCNIPTGSHATIETAFVGTTAAGKATKVCGEPDRVRRAYFWWDTHHSWGIPVISKIQLYCTDGTSLLFGDNNGLNGSWGSSCGFNNLIQGFDVRHGLLIDGAAPRCDVVDNTSTPDWIGAWRGGTGGSLTTLVCPEGSYVYGMYAEYDTGSNPDYNYINGFKLLCRP